MPFIVKTAGPGRSGTSWERAFAWAVSVYRENLGERGAASEQLGVFRGLPGVDYAALMAPLGSRRRTLNICSN